MAIKIKSIYVILSSYIFALSCLNGQTIIFQDNFETGSLNSSWIARPNLVGINGVVGVSTTEPANGLYSVRMGKTSDAGGLTLNALDLKLNLANKSQVEMTFKISDNAEENNIGSEFGGFFDGILFSNDGGVTFQKVFDFEPESWCDQYGQFPPFDIDQLATKVGLTLTSQFVIRFRQFDDNDFNGTNGADGFYIDDVSVYEPIVTYASLPFADNFETGRLGNSWAWRFAEQTAAPALNVSRPSNLVEVKSGIGFNSSNAVRMGSLCDNANNSQITNALDLHLNLANKTQVEMTFRIEDNFDENHPQDGIYFSNDGGLNFKKVFDFKPELWCNQYGQFPPFDIDQLATKAGLALTSQFIIRFQQHDDDDFNGTNGSDGFYIDDVNVYEPVLTYASLPFLDNFELGRLGNSWAWRFAEQTAAPAVDVSRPSNLVEVKSGIGFNSSNAVRMGKLCDDDNNAEVTNALDLHLNLASKTQVEMTFKIEDNFDENHLQDGIYFSNDGGLNFKKVFDFKPELWCNQYGQFPPFDIDQLATKVGLTLTSQFVIRFQQHDDDDFNGTNGSDGFYIDDVNVYEPILTYATLPFSDNFEAARLGNSWAWRFADQTATPAVDFTRTSNTVEIKSGIGVNNTSAVRMGRLCDNDNNAETTNALDLHLNLSTRKGVELSFQMLDNSDETNLQDGIYFSNNGGTSFTKVWNFDFDRTVDGQYIEYKINLDSLILRYGLTYTSQFIIRFQEHDDDDFNGTNGADGIYIDNINLKSNTTGIKEQEINSHLSISPNPANDRLNINYTEGSLKHLKISNLMGQVVIEKTVGSSQTDVNTQSLAKGLYLLTVTTMDGQQATKSFVKD